MSTHLQNELEQLTLNLRSMAALVEKQVEKAVKAMAEHDAKLAESVVQNDHEVDLLETRMEENCLRILALQQPVAKDLRAVVTILKVTHDLERISDLASHIAEKTLPAGAGRRFDFEADFLAMGLSAEHQVRESILAMVEQDAQRARAVWRGDEEIDKKHEHIFACIQEAILREPERARELFGLLAASKNLERLADHATSIAKEVIYLVQGRIVRHRGHEVLNPRPG